MSFSEIPWAGRVAPGLWIESFSVRPLKRFGAQDIEYKWSDGQWVRDPWLSDEENVRHAGACGRAAGRICVAAQASARQRRPTTASTAAIFSPA